jgi:hypothetical protein
LIFTPRALLGPPKSGADYASPHRTLRSRASALASDEEQWDAQRRQRDKEAATERRKQFISTWTEYALRQKPYDAPTEVGLDIHEQVLATLAKVDTTERDYVVRRLVDAAVQRALAAWKEEKAKCVAIKESLSQLPYSMRWSDPWKRRAARAASEALTDVRPGVGRDEMDTLAQTALQPLVLEFEHSEKVENAIKSVSISGATYEELGEARELVRESLAALPIGSSDHQVMQAKNRAVQPVVDRVAGRLAQENGHASASR